MSDRQIAKNRFHKGLTAFFRQTMRKVGVSLDEEMAQFALGGIEPFTGQITDDMIEVINLTFGDRHGLMANWETDNPGRHPFPKSFPERVLPVVREAIRQCLDEESNPVDLLVSLENMCLRELETSPVTIEPVLPATKET